MHAQTKSISAGFGFGFVAPHHPDMWYYITGHAKQFQASYLVNRDSTLSRGSNILKGFTFSLINTGNVDTMGYAIGFNPQFQFPLNRQRKKTWFVLGCGLEYSTKTYTEDHYAFNAISSHFNALIIVGFRRTFRLSTNWNADASLLWTHFSNGATKAPNLGLNIPSLGLGLRYQWNATGDNHTLQEDLPAGQWNLSVNGSWKQVSADLRTMPAFCISAERNISPAKMNSWSIGSDIILDFSVNEKISAFSDTLVPFSDNLKIALKAGWIVPVGKLHIVLQAGSYLKNANFSKEFAFERLALRYYFYKNWGAMIALRAHFAKADAIEFGITHNLP